MRVTESLRFDIVSRQTARLRSQHAEASMQAVSGQRINAPSDDPVAAAEAARLRASKAQTSSYQKTVAIVRGDAEMAEASLEQAGNVLQRARELAMAGANGANGPEQIAAFASEASQLVTQMVEIANAKGSQGYLFAGTRTDTAAFDVNGVFQGNDESHTVQTGAGTPITVNVSGERAFTATGGTDVISTLKNLFTALSANDQTAIRTTLTGIDDSHKQILRERSQAGLILNRLDLSDTILSQTEIDIARRDSDVTSADTPEVFSRLTRLEGAIDTAVTVGKRLLDIGNLQRF